MKKFLEFLNKLLFNKQPEPSVQDMKFISSEMKDGVETIIHGLGKYWIKIEFEVDEENKKGTGKIKSNLKKTLSEEDIIWLLKEYL